MITLAGLSRSAAGSKRARGAVAEQRRLAVVARIRIRVRIAALRQAPLKCAADAQRVCAYTCL